MRRKRQMSELPWWKTGAVYQIYPRSFQDTDGDGIGNLSGIEQRLDYIARLGVQAIWLSPVHPSPQADFGYDVADYLGVDPIFGSLDDLLRLIREAHARGLKVLLDGVFNHTSDAHAWFQDSRASRTSAKRSWYLWRDGVNGGPPNNWASTFGGSAWTFDEATGQYYLHSFLPSQPDLNWREPAVVDAVLAVLQTWFERGVDGFRLDVFNCYLKDATLRSNPRRWHPGGLFYGYIGQHHVHDRDQPDLSDVLGRMRSLADAHGAVLVGETLDENFRYEKAGDYVGAQLLHMDFHFGLLHSRWSAKALLHGISAQLERLPSDGWPTWVLSNHDFKRHPTRWGGGDARAKATAVLATCLRGTPFLYYGEELGMPEARLRRSEIVDPPGKRFWPFFKGRDGARTPMQWDGSERGGFTEGVPWLPLGSDVAERSVASQEGDGLSVLETYRSLLALRKSFAALAAGRQSSLSALGGVLSWRRQAEEPDGPAVWVAVNCTGTEVSWTVPRGETCARVLFRTGTGSAEGKVLRLSPDEAVVLESAGV